MNTTVSRSCRVAFALVAVSLAVTGAKAANDPSVVRHELLGRSTEGRPIRVVEIGDPDATQKILVVGCIHGNEAAGIAIAERLTREEAPSNADLWIVNDLDPDGVAADRRQNGDGVDLNRNFPWHWRPIGRLGTLHYSGPRALSEPESRLAYRLILRLHPAISIWFHQALGVVDESGGSVAIERRFADSVGLPLVRLPRYHGSVTSWENHAFPGTTSFVVELHAGDLSAAETDRYADAVLALGNG